uniref:POU domain protein n=1 Tax=Eptatretus burgeri TaxID=7764 RepID=A0A8C4PZF1_EPTBU
MEEQLRSKASCSAIPAVGLGGLQELTAAMTGGTGPLAMSPHQLQANTLGAQLQQLSAMGLGALGAVGSTGLVCPRGSATKLAFSPSVSNHTAGSLQFQGGIPLAAGGGATPLQAMATPQLLASAQGPVIAAMIGNRLLPVLGAPGLTTASCKPTQVSNPTSSPSLLNMVSSGQTVPSHCQPLAAPLCLPNVGHLMIAPRVGCGDVDGVNLEEIREFARTFKIRRLSLGLTQTQVGQALSAAQGPAYSQSAICRFEKLDITPKSAQKIKPVLERWMAEAEARQQAGIGSLGNITSGSSRSGGDGGDGAGGVCCDGGTASGIGTTSIMTTGMRDSLKKRKRRTSFTPQALELLHVHFERNTHPSGHEMTEIAEQLHYDREVIRVWFCNKRQALKNTIKRLKQSDRTPSTLQSTAKASAIPQSNSSFNAGNFITAPPHKVTTTGSTGGSARPHPDVGSVGIATFQATSVNDTITCSAQQGSSTLTATSFRADYSSGMLNTSTQNLATLGSTCANAQSINAIPLDSNPAICNLSSSAKSLRSCSSSMQNITQFGIKPVASINAMPSSLLTSNILGLSSTPLSCPSSDLPVPTLTIRMPTPADVPLSPVLCHSFSIGEAIASDNASTASLLGFRSSTPSAVGAVQMSAIPSSNFF